MLLMNILLPSFIKKSNALFIVFFILHYLRLYNCVIYKIQALKGTIKYFV